MCHMLPNLSYISHYPEQVQNQVKELVLKNKLASYLLTKYPNTHDINNDKALRKYATSIKNQYLKKSSPLNQVKYDDKIHIINNSLGLHSFISKVQGSKLKSRHEIKIGSLFKHSPLPFLNMIVVHELAHLKEKDHNKAFYQLCLHMLPNYHELELDTRLYLIHLEDKGDIY